jgi:hypothetical protein
MKAPRLHHASLPSFFPTIPTQPVSLRESLLAVWQWCRGTKATARERQFQEAVVARLAAEMDEEAAGPGEQG